MRALITGIGGFVGGHLAPILEADGAEVWGLDRVALPKGHAAAGAGDRIAIGDLCDPAVAAGILRMAKPTHVFHLAGSYGLGEDGRPASHDADIAGFTVLLDAVAGAVPDAWVMLASSSGVYGAAAALPVAEDAPLAPTTAYGASKVAAEAIAAGFARDRALRIVPVRTFNLIGPGIPRRLFAGSFAAQVAAAERGGDAVIKAGRLDPRRDYVDVRDAVRAYLALARLSGPVPGAYNVCTGASHSCREIADRMIALARVPLTLQLDAARLQPGDVDEQRGSAARLRAATGWIPEIPFADSVRDVLDYERNTATAASPDRAR